MKIIAKFLVDRIDHNEDGSGTVYLYPVTSGSKENDQFYYMTPSGQIILSTINMDALHEFEANRYFYVDFTPEKDHN